MVYVAGSSVQDCCQRNVRAPWNRGTAELSIAAILEAFPPCRVGFGTIGSFLLTIALKIELPSALAGIVMRFPLLPCH